MEPLLARKPMAQAQRVSLFHRQISTQLSSAAVEILLGQSQLLSEGSCETDLYLGSTMISIDCQKAGDWVIDPCDCTTLRQLSNLLLRDSLFRDRVQQIAEREAARLARSELGPLQLELSVRVAGTKLHVDLDVEAELAKEIAS